jgi:hypothetical protein
MYFQIWTYSKVYKLKLRLLNIFKKEVKKVMKIYNWLLAAFMLVLMTGSVFALTPSGGTVTPGTSSSAPEDAAGDDDALAGNVTQINIFGYTTTQSWQGYFGNVSGVIQLADASDNVMYNWSLASPEGEVYASTANTISWSSVQCASGANLSTLETTFNIASDDVDGVTETFSLDDHAEFFTNNIQFSAGECNNTKVYDNTGAGVFDEVLLMAGAEAIFVALLQEDTLGFNDVTHDFEMLVLEDGHATDIVTTPYYFWVELE